MSHPDLVGIETGLEARRRRLRSFRVRVEADDVEMIQAWRGRSAAEHAAAGAAVSDLAARVAAQTGLNKARELTFPPLSSLRALHQQRG